MSTAQMQAPLLINHSNDVSVFRMSEVKQEGGPLVSTPAAVDIVTKSISAENNGGYINIPYVGET